MTVPRTWQPKDFTVNEVWLAYRMNDAPVVNEDGVFDIYVLQDAGSMFLFGNVFAPAESHPDGEAVAELLTRAFEKKEVWPKALYVPGRLSNRNPFVRLARWQGIAVRGVPESQLSFYMRDVQEAFADFLKRNPGDA